MPGRHTWRKEGRVGWYKSIACSSPKGSGKLQHCQYLTIVFIDVKMFSITGKSHCWKLLGTIILPINLPRTDILTILLFLHYVKLFKYALCYNVNRTAVKNSQVHQWSQKKSGIYKKKFDCQEHIHEHCTKGNRPGDRRETTKSCSQKCNKRQQKAFVSKAFLENAKCEVVPPIVI